MEKAKLTTKDKCAYSQKPERETITNDDMNIPASAGFFVFTGVTAFLYSFAFAIIYVFFRHKYNNIIFLPLIVIDYLSYLIWLILNLIFNFSSERIFALRVYIPFFGLPVR